MNNWDNKHILVTRPSHQAQGLIAQLSTKGASVLLFPTLTIHDVPDIHQLKTSIQSHLNADWYMFISPNAVEHGLSLIKKQGWLSHMKGQFATVGAGTRDALAEYGISNIRYPLNGVGALALLEALKYENFAGQSVAVFKGDSNNQILEEGLIERGATLHPITCYKRQRTQDDPMPLLHALEHDHINLILTTSGDGLQSLVDLVPAQYRTQLFTLPVLVISERVKLLAQTLGFSSILLAKDASDEAIVAAIDNWQSQGALHD